VRLLHLSDRLTDRGGAYWHLLGVLGRLAPDHEVRLAVGADPGHIPPPCPTAIVPGLGGRGREPCAPALDALAEAFRPHAIHVHTVVNPEALAWAAERGAVMTVQDHRYFCPTRGKWTRDGRLCREPLRPGLCAACFEDEAYFREVYGLTGARLAALGRMRAVVVLSEYMQAELAAVGVSAAVIPPFVHGLENGSAASGPPCLLFVGRLAESKGVWDAVAAWRRSGLDLPLVVAGTGPLRSALQREGLDVRGWVDHGQLAGLYRQARAVLMPSRWQEPFGIVGLEAVSVGTPVAAWDCGGVRDWHPGEGLVPWGDVAGLARAACQLVGTRAAPPAGFEAGPLMDRLVALYRA
jgi:glycosyltransferase involved in cell wall biosynthesis